MWNLCLIRLDLSLINSRPSSRQLLSIEQDLVWLYMMNGAESESNESASSHLKVKPLSGLTLMILNRTADVPTASAIFDTNSSS